MELGDFEENYVTKDRNITSKPYLKKRMKGRPSRHVCDKCGYATPRKNDFIRHKDSVHSMCAKREFTDQKAARERESFSEIRDLFHELSSWSKVRAES